ncbi:hypothetical protein AMECASPLE_029964 [Ameca splendens]|uniref:Uncharacterized protein n=1 Tax=Ameca splendens TaxID=208324 RepID=A0ABV0Y5V5_9TELE
MARTKATERLLNLSFNIQSEPPLKHTLQSCFLKISSTTPVCHSTSVIPVLCVILKRRVNQLYNVQRLQHLSPNLTHTCQPATRELLNYLGTSATVINSPSL